MENTVTSLEGGYKVLPLKDYEVKIAAGTITMFPVGTDRQSGPGMFMTGEKFTSPVDLETAVNVFQKNESSFIFSRVEKTQIDGTPALALDFTKTYYALDGVILENPGAAEGETIHGRVVMAVYQNYLLFKCVMLAPEKTWKSFEPAFKSSIRTLSFIP